MSIIVQQPTGSIQAVGTTMTVQDVLNRVSSDTRFQLSATSASDQAILIDYVNRVHLELLRASKWKFLISGLLSFTTQAGKTDYYIGNTGLPNGTVDTGLLIPDLGSIRPDSVKDTTNYRPLFRILEAPLAESLIAVNSRPRFYRSDPASQSLLNIYPPPDGAYGIQFRYQRQVPTLAATVDPIQVPDKYVDVLVAGVDELAFAYLKRADETMYWKQRFADGLRDMIRDINREESGGPAFIGPDPTTQTSWWVGPDSFLSGTLP